MADENSRGEKNIIYFASFNLGDAKVYVELGGDETDSDILRAEIGSVIEQLIQNGAPELSQITK